MRADDVLKHSEFESSCTSNLSDRHEEERMCDHLISAARRRDAVLAGEAPFDSHQLFLPVHSNQVAWWISLGQSSVTHMVLGARRLEAEMRLSCTLYDQASPGSMVSVASSCDSIPTREPVTNLASRDLPTNFWKLDVWEDDARRRKRFFHK